MRGPMKMMPSICRSSIASITACSAEGLDWTMPNSVWYCVRSSAVLMPATMSVKNGLWMSGRMTPSV